MIYDSTAAYSSLSDSRDPVPKNKTKQKLKLYNVRGGGSCIIGVWYLEPSGDAEEGGRSMKRGGRVTWLLENTGC